MIHVTRGTRSRPAPDSVPAVSKPAAGRSSTAGAIDGSTLGLTFAFSVLVGFAIGYGLDRLFHTAPFLMLAFILLGLASGILNIVRAARESTSK
jgi:ATP synthase protein I